MDFLKSKIWPVNPCKFFWQYFNTWFWYMESKLEKIKSRQDGFKTGWMQKRLDERKTYPLGRSLMTKEYISIKNTKQTLLVFIPGPFILESRKLWGKLHQSSCRQLWEAYCVGVCVYCTLIVSCVHCTVGWVNFLGFKHL